jgi:hypothetical protein
MLNENYATLDSGAEISCTILLQQNKTDFHLNLAAAFQFSTRSILNDLLSSMLRHQRFKGNRIEVFIISFYRTSSSSFMSFSQNFFFSLFEKFQYGGFTEKSGFFYLSTTGTLKNKEGTEKKIAFARINFNKKH